MSSNDYASDLSLQQIFRQDRGSTWRPLTTEIGELVERQYPQSTYDEAMNIIALTPSKRPEIRRRLENSVKNLALLLYWEMKPGGQHIDAELKAMRKAAQAVLDNYAQLHISVRQALIDKSAIMPIGEPWLADALVVPEGRIQGAMTVLEHFTDWCDQTLRSLPRRGRGSPQKNALLDWAINIAQIYKMATGADATRRYDAYQNSPREDGPYRQFANALLKPLGLHLSDDMAKRAISESPDVANK